MPKKNSEKEARRERYRDLIEFLDSVGVIDANIFVGHICFSRSSAHLIEFV